MTFNSFTYVVFLAAVTLLAWASNCWHNLRWRNLLLLAASYLFYGLFHLWFVGLLLYVSLIAYLGGRWITIAQRRGDSGKKELTLTIALSLLCLLFFKYGHFVSKSIVLPVGLSFFTFQALTYSIDIYRKKTEPEDLLSVLLFVAFFPTLLSGPIERSRNIIPQLKSNLDIRYENVTEGVELYIWGLFKKAVIADRLGLFVDEIYFNPTSHSGSTLGLAAVFYSFQIYADFSGYADMAIGSARILGIKLMDNFNFPYFAKSIKDFWRRWHISLTSWFTEYVYISLGGNRVGKARWVMNISLVFLLSGIWHGATFSFIVWGAMHAILYLTEHFLYRERIPNALYRLFVFATVTSAWVFFRVTDIGQAWSVVAGIFTNFFSPVYLGMSSFSTLLTMMLLLLFVLREWLLFKPNPLKRTSWECVFLLLATFLFGLEAHPFVYFQF